jgi:hypothetical protein
VGHGETSAISGVTTPYAGGVGGGGSGGYNQGGGGGAGGFTSRTGLSVTAGTTYTITVGAGGALSNSGSALGKNGSNSVFGHNHICWWWWRSLVDTGRRRLRTCWWVWRRRRSAAALAHIQAGQMETLQPHPLMVAMAHLPLQGKAIMVVASNTVSVGSWQVVAVVAQEPLPASADGASGLMAGNGGNGD